MGVFAPPKRRPILTDLDKEMLARLLQQSQTPIEAYTRESALGVPWGSLANSLVGGMLVGRERNKARNLEKQRDKAAVALLTGRGTELQPQLFEGGEFEAGEYITPAGNFVTQLAPVEQGVPETKEEYMARMLRNKEIAEEQALFDQFVSDQPDKVDYTRMLPQEVIPQEGYTGTTLTEAKVDPSSAVMRDGYVPPQPIGSPAVEREEISPQKTVEGITIEGSKEDPDWWDRNISGEIPEATAKNQVELALLAGYDPLEYMTYAQKQQTQGHRILTIDQAIEEGITNAKEMAGNDGFFQKNLKNNKIELIGGGGDTTTITMEAPAVKYGIKSTVERFGKTLDANYAPGGILDKSKSALRVANNLLGILETGDFKTGKWAPYRDWLYKHAAELGWLDADELKSLAGMDTFTAESNQIVLKFIKNLGRNPTDLDLTFMIQTMPNIGKSILANKMIIKMGATVEQHNVNYLTALDNYRLDRNLELHAQGKDYTVESNTQEISLYEDYKRKLRKETQELLDTELEELRKEILQIEQYEKNEGSNYTYEVIEDPKTGKLIFKN
jgi:hypothetical protein